MTGITRRGLIGGAATTTAVAVGGCMTIRSVYEPEYVITYRRGVKKYDRAVNKIEEANEHRSNYEYVKSKNDAWDAVVAAGDADDLFTESWTLAKEENERKIAELAKEAGTCAYYLHECAVDYHQGMRTYVSGGSRRSALDQMRRAQAMCDLAHDFDVAPASRVAELAE